MDDRDINAAAKTVEYAVRTLAHDCGGSLEDVSPSTMQAVIRDAICEAIGRDRPTPCWGTITRRRLELSDLRGRIDVGT